MENKIKVSVIVPVYNQEKYLEQCVKSILVQTLHEAEFIFVDDGSTDSSLSMLKEYEKQDSRVKVITQENGGAGKARNTGLSVARGEYLSFLDSDDFFEPDMLEKAVAALEDSKADFVVFHSDQWWEDEQCIKTPTWVVRDQYIPPYRPMSFRSFTDNVFKVFVGWTWDKVYRTDFVKKYNLTFQEQRTSNDMRFVFSALILADSIEVIPDILAHQRRNNKESLSNTREKSWDCFYNALVSLRENLISYNLYNIMEQDFINYALHFSLWNLDTITGEKKELLFNTLKENWFTDLKITEHSENYFYNKNEYRKYLNIMKNNFENYNVQQKNSNGFRNFIKKLLRK